MLELLSPLRIGIAVAQLRAVVARVARLPRHVLDGRACDKEVFNSG